MGLFEKKVRKVTKAIEKEKIKKTQNEVAEKVAKQLAERLKDLLNAKLPEKSAPKKYSLFKKPKYDFV